MEFAKWLQTVEAYGHEQPVIAGLQGQDFAGQAQIDKNLHQAAVGTGRFNQDQEKFLAHDTQGKSDFQQIVNTVKAGKMPSKELLKKTIRRLEYDQKIHGNYLGQPQNPNTGSHNWHKTWIDTYDQWLTYLKGLLAHHPA